MSNEMFYMIMTPIVVVLFICLIICESGYQKAISKTVNDYLDKDDNDE